MSTNPQHPARWVRLCSLAEAPAEQQVCEIEVEAVSVCLARLGGELLAVDNWCPHRRGPLGQGWIEGDAIVCPWHSWAFNLKTGDSEYPAGHRVKPYPIRQQGDDLLVSLPSAASGEEQA